MTGDRTRSRFVSARFQHARATIRHRGVCLPAIALCSVALQLCSCASAPVGIPELTDTVSVPIANGGFEDVAAGWTGLLHETSEYFAPPEGTGYARVPSGSEPLVQQTGHLIEAGRSYMLTVWSRSINPPGLGKHTPVEVSVLAGGEPVATVTRDVSPPRLTGDPRDVPNDDGANVWLDGEYRVQMSDMVLFQRTEDDPLRDPWTALEDPDYDTDLAMGTIITAGGLRAVYSTYYEDRSPFYSEISLIRALGSPPNYQWRRENVVLSNSGSDQPWVIDAHLFEDTETERLWMSWGGGTVYVTEMDPATGSLLADVPGPEVSTHPDGTHTAVATWSGDEWTGGNRWFEGPALYRRGAYWYLFASYGDLAVNYSIRVGRGTRPTGPFVDKDGVGLLEWDDEENEYGNSFVLAGEGGQDSPGHPHIWEENGVSYLGYDYVDTYDWSRTDRMGIRELYWVDDWPTVWQPIQVYVSARDLRSVAGRELGIALASNGEPLTEAGFDLVTVRSGVPAE